MNVGGSMERPALLALLSLLVALVTVSAALYQNYIYTKQLEAIQRNVVRSEFIRACRDVIEAYFQTKLRVGLILGQGSATGGGPVKGQHEIEAANAVSRLGAIGTYLANFQNEDIRFRYTMLTRELSRIVLAASHSSETDVDKLFAKADELFTGMNDDCVKLAKAVPL
jgi:hypothetical protein